MKYFTTIFLILIICSCGKVQKDVRKLNREKEEVEISYATGFGLIKSGDDMIIELYSPFQDQADTLTFFVSRSTDINNLPDEFIPIPAPLTKIILMASTHSAYLDELDKIDIVKAISSRNYFYNLNIQEKIENEEIKEVGYSQNINFEEVLMIDPQLVVISGMSSADLGKFSSLTESGITIFPSAEWQEEHPLGRAEWIKVFGVLTGQFEKSVSIFSEIERNYKSLIISDSEKTHQPKVIVNAPFKDVWWLPGGNSYMSHLLDNAGANYPWQQNESTGGIQSDLEAVFFEAGDADVWINPGTSRSVEALKGTDGRYEEFKAVKTGKVYNNTLRTGDWGGNDYFENGVVHPEWILADLIKIFYPDQSKDHNFYFYEKLE